jgi:ribosomal protein L18E
MGPGCETVVRTQTTDTDIVTGTWADGRIGTYRGIRKNKADFGAVAFGTKAIKSIEKAGGYGPLCVEIAKFLITKKSPIDNATTIEMFAFMEAADESKRSGGQPVEIADVMKKADAVATKRLAEITGQP